MAGEGDARSWVPFPAPQTALGRRAVCQGFLKDQITLRQKRMEACQKTNPAAHRVTTRDGGDKMDG